MMKMQIVITLALVTFAGISQADNTDHYQVLKQEFGNAQSARMEDFPLFGERMLQCESSEMETQLTLVREYCIGRISDNSKQMLSSSADCKYSSSDYLEGLKKEGLSLKTTGYTSSGELQTVLTENNRNTQWTVTYRKKNGIFYFHESIGAGPFTVVDVYGRCR